MISSAELDLSLKLQIRLYCSEMKNDKNSAVGLVLLAYTEGCSLRTTDLTRCALEHWHLLLFAMLKLDASKWLESNKI